MTGFSIVHGHVGYLREAYHGGPYATQVLMPEGWDDDPDVKWDNEDYENWWDPIREEWRPNDEYGVRIDAELLEQRLADALTTIVTRAKEVCEMDDTDPDDAKIIAAEQKSYRDFVALARSKQDELGHPVTIRVSA